LIVRSATEAGQKTRITAAAGARILPGMGPDFPASELHTRRIRVADQDLVWVRSVLEAYDGLAQWFSDGSGILELSAPASQAAELDALLDELSREAPIHLL
jgi:hypothetical protein